MGFHLYQKFLLFIWNILFSESTGHIHAFREWNVAEPKGIIWPKKHLVACYAKSCILNSNMYLNAEYLSTVPLLLALAEYYSECKILLPNIMGFPLISVLMISCQCLVVLVFLTVFVVLSFLRMVWMMNTMKYKKGETRSHCLSSVIRPPSTATVIGIQSDGESLLEERRGGDAQKGCSGETDHATLHSSALLSHPTGFYRHLQTTDSAHLLCFGVVFHFLIRHWFSDQLSFVMSCSCLKFV